MYGSEAEAMKCTFDSLTYEAFDEDIQSNANAILRLQPEEPVSHPATTIVIQLELSLNKQREGTWEGDTECLQKKGRIV